MIQYTVSPQGSSVTFTSDHPEIASVAKDGLVSGIAEGQCTITVQCGTQKGTVYVTVTSDTPQKDDEPQQMPLLKFDAQLDDEGTLIDPEIIAYEEALGRKPYTIHHASGEDKVGFANPEKTIITATIYGMSVGDLAQTIAAYSTESVDNCPRTREMLRKLGFSNIEEIQIPIDEAGNTAPALKSVNDKNRKLTAYVISVEYPELKAHSYMEFIQERGALPPYVAHETLPNARDFPDISNFIKKDVTGIKSFEEQLALRTQDVDLSLGGNLWFDTKSELEQNTNIGWINYVFNPDGSTPFINVLLNCIADQADLKSETFSPSFTAKTSLGEFSPNI